MFAHFATKKKKKKFQQKETFSFESSKTPKNTVFAVHIRLVLRCLLMQSGLGKKKKKKKRPLTTDFAAFLYCANVSLSVVFFVTSECDILILSWTQNPPRPVT
ncbi:hypothetical protein FQA47_000201 [Oryzias melastigma]|uniref:Uncharacterized protein n=1 Tax=Oryzias melastigma TaxID=30732 RepID=A0A834F3X4_ORYME|nr:hypothetical protein FQA47_000201 [Oryzias melastigma]